MLEGLFHYGGDGGGDPVADVESVLARSPHTHPLVRLEVLDLEDLQCNIDAILLVPLTETPHSVLS